VFPAPFASSEAVAQLRQLAEEFAPELLAIGVDPRVTRRNLDALYARSLRIEALLHAARDYPVQPQ
jgi:hypothetical protein